MVITVKNTQGDLFNLERIMTSNKELMDTYELISITGNVEDEMITVDVINESLLQALKDYNYELVEDLSTI